MAQATGRAVPAPQEFTFPNGKLARISRVSQFTLGNLQAAAQRRIPRPAPPLAAGVGGAMEPNPADPDYEAALITWQQQIALAINDLTLDLAVQLTLDDDDRGELEQLRATLERLDAPLDEVSDKVAYIKHIALAGVGEATELRDQLVALLSLATGKAAPTEADVTAHVATFRPAGANLAHVGGDAAL